MTNETKKKLGQVIFGCIAFMLLVTLCFLVSSAIFLVWHKQPIVDARPFLIFEYWEQYGTIKKYRASFYASWAAPWLLLGGLAVLIFADQSKRSLHGDARFAKANEVQKSGLLKAGSKSILVGKYQGKYLQFSGFQFAMIAAPTRSGKGVGIVIPNCLNYSDSLVVLDIKLENFDITAGFRAAHGQEVFLFAPFDENGRTHRYNPLGYISDDPNQRIDDIFSIAYGFYADPETGDVFWSANARNLFIGLCLFLCETPELPRTIGELLRQASGKGQPLKEYITDFINKRNDPESENPRPLSANCTDALGRFIGNSDNTLAGILSSFNAPLMIWANPRVDAATAANDFNLNDVRKRRMTIYIGVQPNKLGDAKVLINLFLNQLYNLNTKELPAQNPDLKYQCLSLLDEFTAIGKVEIIDKSVSYMAGYNMRLLTIIQNKSQLKKVYTEAGATTLMANHALMVMYAPSPLVQSDAVEYSEMLGYETVKGISKSKQAGGGGRDSESSSDQRRALMLPQEIRELGQDNEIVLIENTKPIKCKKIKYYDDPNFKVRMNLPTPEIPTLNMTLHMAIIENRQRDMTVDDVKGGLLAEQIVGLSALQELTSDGDIDVDAFVDDFFDHVVDLGISEEEALAMVDDVFDSIKDENDEADDDDEITHFDMGTTEVIEANNEVKPTGATTAPFIDLTKFYEE